jgi:alkanesulfonate monooxygenase SsuD/methylene tetrahydromethanopterin reductase-like flavin-dependent oxidoreductase (luciferase family)
VVLVGTPEEMEEELTRRREAYGISLLTVAFSTPEQMRQFGEQVLPRFS